MPAWRATTRRAPTSPALAWPTDRHAAATTAHRSPDNPNPESLPLISDYVDYAGEVLGGFEPGSAIYFQLSAPSTSIAAPSEQRVPRPKAVVHLVDAANSAFRRALAARLPAARDHRPGRRRARPVLHRHDARHAPGLRLPAGRPRDLLRRPHARREGRRRAPRQLASGVFRRAPERGVAGALAPGSPPTSALAAADVAAATCFTTQDATKDLRVVEHFLEGRTTSATHDLKYTGKTQHFHEILGEYATPNFQSGVKPYRTTGGDMKFDGDGNPIVQLDEPIRFRLLIPRNFDMPAAGWPVVLYSHGTFGDWTTCRDGNESQVLQEGLAMICIDQPLHGVRAVDGVGADVSFLDVFNFLNPRSGRMSFRQSAIDTMWLSKMVTEGRFDFAADATTFGQAIKLDPATIVFFGHSHGGLAGAIVLAIDPRLKGAVLSGASGILVETILRRVDPLDIRATLASILNLDADQLDTFHPMMTMAQTLVDATDPVNYAPYWLEPVTGGNSKHVLMTEGTLDGMSPAVGADAVAAAAGIPLIEPVDHESQAHVLRGLFPVTMPVNSNLRSSTGQLVTGGIRQFAGGDHFVALELPEAISIWRGFFRAFRQGDIPTIAP
ncbi:MAG: hypothetical protein U1F43_32645 [Myxococcota bacterium]